MANLKDNKYYQQALEFIRANDLSSFTPGKHVVDENNVWVNIVETDLRPAEEALLEAHNDFIDIHIPFNRSESYGVKARSSCRLPKGEFNVTDDCILYDDEPDAILTGEAGTQTVFEPDTAHAPLIGTGRIRKAIVKIRVEK
ncbi:MAG: YhcH/YjgK/YiaL family protein [Bacteroidales bacterium]|nr:YhcH/YjgK/YiaL family protein [Candidatus Hennigimonas equi]